MQGREELGCVGREFESVGWGECEIVSRGSKRGSKIFTGFFLLAPALGPSKLSCRHVDSRQVHAQTRRDEIKDEMMW